MRNNIKIITFVLKLLLIFCGNAMSGEQFNFDVTEVEIIDNGNKFIGTNRGKITTEDGIIIDANEFEYNKITNILDAKGNVKIIDNKNFYTIFTDNITYFKNEEKIFTSGNSKAINDGVIIKADKFNYDKSSNILIAKDNVFIDDTNEDVKIFSNKITYQKNEERIFTTGLTTFNIENKYNAKSKNVYFDRLKAVISSDYKTEILDDKSNFYELEVFKYFKNIFLLKGRSVKLITNRESKNNKSDEYFFSEGFFNLKEHDFTAGATKINLHKDLFGNIDNDPRIFGASSIKEGEITQINKGVFTSCKKSDKCPPWSMSAGKITHDKNKKRLIYDNAILKIYEKPILYFPKFFHPDPTVDRMSGILKPQFNDSDILGSSFQIPYFYVLSNNRDFTFTPNFFDSDLFMIQNEFRQKTINSELIADFAYTNGYKSKYSNQKKNISHLFAKLKTDLKIDHFQKSILDLNIEKVTNDTYLKVFDSNLLNTIIKPSNKNALSSSISIELDHDKYDLNAGLTSYEKLSGSNSDRYQFILPYYDFSKNLFYNDTFGNIDFTSSGNNNLKDTNNLRSRITNNFNYSSNSYYSDLGLKNNFNIFFKNLNTVAKNDLQYKTSPQVELLSLFEAQTSYPLIKETGKYSEFIIPKISLRINPSDMKDYSDSGRLITANNIFDINRLGLTDTYEEGKSLTLGIDYKKEKFDDINRYFEFKLGKVFRDSYEELIPNSSTINKKNSNLFGSIKSNINEMFNFDYQYSINNGFDKIEYNSLTAQLDVGFFSTKMQFLEQNGVVGDSNTLKNSFTYNIDEKNFLTFETRRNRKINLTEYYDLVYEYKNDCLIAGFKYKKTYYQDRDLRPTEDLLLSVTIFPLTTYEKKYSSK